MSGNPPLFEWDEDKAELNESRHGVTFAEASTAVLDPLALTRADPAHSRDEVRYIDLGVSVAGRVLVVVYRACPKVPTFPGPPPRRQRI
jgi:uncharacterized DUF497 family protein